MTLTDIYCHLASLIECGGCGRRSRLNRLHFETASSLPEPGGKVSATGYFYCQCNAKNPIAYQQAVGRIILSDPDKARLVEE